MDSTFDEEELLAKHRKERKDLQVEIQKLKKSVSKGDKKRKKEVTEEIAKLEANLNAQQENESDALKASSKSAGEQDESVSTDLTTLVVAGGTDEIEEEEEEECNEQVQKKSKAQKRRDKKQSKNRERDQRIQEQVVLNRLGPRHQEMVAVSKILKDKGLALHEIAADGNCMYNAIGHQLALRNVESSYQELREKTAIYMRDHPDDFLPFLIHPDSENMMTSEQFSAYCDKTAKSPVWGGQLELRALSEVLDLPIEVLQADIQPLLIGDTKAGPPLTVVYHRHAYRLGEHYNSVLPRSGADDDDGIGIGDNADVDNQEQKEGVD